MRDKLEQILKELQQAMLDLEKVEAGAYGFKSAAPRARKVLMESTKKLRDLRIEIQEKKKEHEEK
jgi:hypothetical protein